MIREYNEIFEKIGRKENVPGKLERAAEGTSVLATIVSLAELSEGITYHDKVGIYLSAITGAIALVSGVTWLTCYQLRNRRSSH